MKLLLATLMIMMLVGCSTTVPVKQRWPAAPAALQERCPPLKQLDQSQGTLRDLLMVMIDNYAVYYSCAGRTQGWQDWYTDQKKIFEDSNK
jgi:hypothetical protein